MTDTQWVLVPREATPEMKKASAMYQKLPDGSITMFGSNAWPAMLGASPTPPIDRDKLLSAIEALMNYEQADMDGIMVKTSRQAIHEVEHAVRAILKSMEATP